MKARRCGCPDVVRNAPDPHWQHAHGQHAHGQHTHRHKRFVVAAKGWKRRHLKY